MFLSKFYSAYGCYLTVVSILFWPFLLNLFCAHTIIHPKPPNDCATLIKDAHNMPNNVACGSKWLLGCGDVAGIGSGEVALVYFLLKTPHGPKSSTDHNGRRG